MAVVLITGCSSGIGLASALAFARAGDRVYASLRDPDSDAPWSEIASREALDIRAVGLDLTKPDSFDSCINHIVRDSGCIDVLVNNAGVWTAGALEDLSEIALRRVMDTNVLGPLLLTRAVLPQMRAQASGYIIMISSLSGVAGLPGDVAYSASKFALEGAAEALRHEVDRWGIHVALVEAALYATGLFDGSFDGANSVPPDYPENSPYRVLVEHRLSALRNRLPDALDPAGLAELLVTISRSDGIRLRWQADELSRRVCASLMGQSDSERDGILRAAADLDWWSEGKPAPEHDGTAEASQ